MRNFDFFDGLEDFSGLEEQGLFGFETQFQQTEAGISNGFSILDSVLNSNMHTPSVNSFTNGLDDLFGFGSSDAGEFELGDSCGCVMCSTNDRTDDPFAQLSAVEGFSAFDGMNDSAPSSLTTLADYLENGYWNDTGRTAHWFNVTNSGTGSNNGILYYNVSGFTGVSGRTDDSNGLSAARQQMVHDAFDIFEDVLGIDFRSTASTSSNVDIFFADNNGTGDAFANYDYHSGNGGAVDFAYINVGSSWNGGSTGIDSYSFHTIIHEIGHALGLGHQSNYNNSANYPGDADFDNDSWQASIMSYFSQTENTTINADYAQLISPMSVDWIALDDLYSSQGYGISNAFTGNTTWGFNTTINASTNPPQANNFNNAFHNISNYADTHAFTIIDGGGIDTLDFSGFSDDQTINLAPSSASSTAPSISSVGGLEGNMTLAVGTIIENAIGGSGDDSLYGNNENNILTGNGGDDFMKGGGGNDTLYGGSGADELKGGGGNDTLRGQSGNDEISGGDGNDTLYAGAGVDEVYGGSGNDYLYMNSLQGGETWDGGSGSDWITFNTFSGSYDVNLTAETFQTTSSTHLSTMESIENVVAGAGDDVITGQSDANIIKGGGGNDTIYGMAGEDSLQGNAGNDTLDGGDGQDTIYGGDGNDTIIYSRTETSPGEADDMYGGDGTDTFEVTYDGFDSNWTVDLVAGEFQYQGNNRGSLDSIENVTVAGAMGVTGDGNANIIIATSATHANVIDAGAGNDSVNAGGGNDTVSGGSGHDTLLGDDGDDTLNGNAGNDTLKGGGGNDTLDGGSGDDTVKGGGGDDTIIVAGGSDSVEGGDGNDSIYLMGGNGGSSTIEGDAGDDIIGFGSGALTINNSFDGGSGVDTFDLSNFNDGYEVNLTNGANNVDGATIANFENVLGSNGVDTLIGTNGANVIEGNGGDDVLASGLGDDIVNGGAGNDTIYTGHGTDLANGGDGNDTIIGGDDVDTLYGGIGNDNINGGSGNDVLGGEEGNDVMAGGGGDDTMTGGDGDDNMSGGLGDDMLSGGAGADSMYGGAGSDTMNGNDGDDTIVAAGGDDTVNGGNGADTIYAGDGNNSVISGADNDTVVGGDDIDVISGGGGDDAIYAKGGNDTVYGGDGNDSVFGNDGNDTLLGNNGADTMSGGNGLDLMYGGNHNDLMYGGDGSDTVYGDNGDDTLVGGNGNDVLNGGAGNDKLYGSANTNMLYGGIGDDNYYGGTSGDTFVFSLADGASVERVSFFNLVDTVQLNGFGFANAAASSASFAQAGGNVVFNSGGVQIIFYSANVGQVRSRVSVDGLGEAPDPDKANVAELPDELIKLADDDKSSINEDDLDNYVLDQDLIAEFLLGNAEAAPFEYVGKNDILTISDDGQSYDDFLTDLLDAG